MIVSNLMALPNSYFRKHEKAVRRLVEAGGMVGCTEGYTHFGKLSP